MAKPVDFRAVADRVIDVMGLEGRLLTEDGVDILKDHVINGLCLRNAEMQKELQAIRDRRADAVRLNEKQRAEIYKLKELLAAKEG